MKRKLWIISELFYPNESATAHILTQMAKTLTAAFEVNVICADSNYENDRARVVGEEDLPGINVVRVKVPGLDKNSLPKRLLRLISVSRRLYAKARKLIKPGDVVFAVTNPALLMLKLRHLKRSLGMEYILLVHDVFPDNAVATGMMRKSALLERIFAKAYAAPDKVLVLGEDMKEVIAAKTGRPGNIFVCPNWGEDGIVPQMRQADGKVVLQYAGNMGRVQGLEELMGVISGLENRNLEFHFWGSGALVPFIANFADGSTVKVCGSYNRAMQNRVLGSCDIAIVSLAKGMKGLGVPSKTYNILAAGKPILFVGDRGSEIYNLVRDNDLGAAFDWSEAAELREWLEALTPDSLEALLEKGKRSRLLYENSYTEEVILSNTLETVCLENE